MTKQSDTDRTPAKPRTASTPLERLSIACLIAVLLLSNLLFFSQVLTYTT